MNFLNGMLNAEWTFGWDKVIEKINASGNGDWSWLSNLLSALSTVLWVLLALVGAAGAIYALYVGVKMARADSAEQRDENKKRLVNIIVSIVVVIVLIIFFNLFLPAILSGFGVFDKYYEPKTEGGAALVRLLLHA